MNSFIKILSIIAFILILFQILMNSIFGTGFANNSLIYFYSFIALIGFAWFIDLIKKDISISYLKKNYKKPLLLILLIMGIIIGIIGVLSFEFEILSLIVWFYFLFAVLYVFESRISASIAILLLGYALMTLILKDTGLARDFAVYAFYFLIITIITHMREYTSD